MADTNGLYSVTLAGEKNSYGLRNFEQRGFLDVCEMLSDLTGYKAEHMRDDKLKRMKIGEVRGVAPADRGNWDGVPTFIVRRVG